MNQLNDKVIEEETKLKIKEERVGITNKILDEIKIILKTFNKCI